MTASTSRIPRQGDAGPDDHRGAARFFWTVLVLATAASIGGNVTHAILKAGSGHMVWVAAAVAMVPPIVLLAATHSVGLLVRTRSSGPIYWAALSITIGLSGCAFALSFDALWELAVNAGVSNRIAWLWPLSIDMSIAQATIALLSLTRRAPAATSEVAAPATPNDDPRPAPTPPTADTAALGAERRVPPPPGQAVANLTRRREDPGVRPSPVVAADLGVRAHAALAAVPSPPGTDWSDVAAMLVRDGVTAKPAEQVVAVLDLWEVNTPPNTIAKQCGLHRDTVTRITGAAEDLLSAAKIRA